MIKHFFPATIVSSLLSQRISSLCIMILITHKLDLRAVITYEMCSKAVGCHYRNTKSEQNGTMIVIKKIVVNYHHLFAAIFLDDLTFSSFILLRYLSLIIFLVWRDQKEQKRISKDYHYNDGMWYLVAGILKCFSLYC